MKPPIADPFESPPQLLGHREFRVDFLRSLVGYFCFHFLVLGPFLLTVLAPIRDDRKIFVFLASLIFAALISAAVGLLYPVKISPSGLRGTNYWCVKREVEWAEITRARFGWFVFSYALISTARKRNFIWLPLCLQDKKVFAQTVEEWAPADNPLRLWIQKRGF